MGGGRARHGLRIPRRTAPGEMTYWDEPRPGAYEDAEPATRCETWELRPFVLGDAQAAATGRCRCH